MAFMKFYVGNEANASSHRDGIYIAVDTKKIFYNGSAYGGSEVDLSNYYTIAQVDDKIGTNVYTGANYISKETNLTEAVLQLDEEIKATNDNLALEHTNAEATYAKKTELGNYLPLSGGSMTGRIRFTNRYSTYLMFPNGRSYLVNDRLRLSDDNNYNYVDYHRYGINMSFWPDGIWQGGKIILGVDDNHQSSTKPVLSVYTGKGYPTIIVGYNGVDISGKSDTDILNANGGTVSIQDIISQVTVPTKVSELTNDSGYQTESQVAAKVSALVDSAPETLNTLNELAAALGDDPNFATTVSTKLGKKLDITTYTSDKATFALKSEIPNVSNFLTISNAQNTYLTKTDARNTYQPKGSYLTSVSIATISDLNSGWDALLKAAPNIPSLNGYATQEWVNGRGFLTSIPSEYVTDTELNAKGFLTKATADGYYQPKGNYLTSVSWSQISGKPTIPNVSAVNNSGTIVLKIDSNTITFQSNKILFNGSPIMVIEAITAGDIDNIF